MTKMTQTRSQNPAVVIQDIRKVFEERDTDNSGRIDISEMSAAMKALQVNLSADEVKSLFKVSLEPNVSR